MAVIISFIFSALCGILVCVLYVVLMGIVGGFHISFFYFLIKFIDTKEIIFIVWTVLNFLFVIVFWCCIKYWMMSKKEREEHKKELEKISKKNRINKDKDPNKDEDKIKRYKYDFKIDSQ